MGYPIRLFKISTVFISTFFLLSITLAQPAFANTQKILVWGDSLSAAYGIPVEKGWVNLMQNRLGNSFEIINGSISGETTQGGLSRLPAALKTHQPQFVILELGANDGLRGISPQVTKRNLKRMIEVAKAANAKVVLLGMRIPPNYGITYSQQFEAQFVQLAQEYQLAFIPFFLEDIIENLAFFQADELHPTADAQPIILETVLATLNKVLAIPENKNVLKTEKKSVKNSS